MSDNTTLVAVDRGRLASVGASLAELVTALEAVPCDNEAQYAWWSERLTMVQTTLKDLEAEREVLVRPLLDDKRLVDGAFAAATKPATALKELVSTKLNGYLAAQATAQEALRLAAAGAAALGDTEGCQQALAKLDAAPTAAGVAVAWVWEYTVIGPVPVHYAKVDDAKVKAYIKECDRFSATPAIAGLAFKRVPKSRPTGKGV